MVRKYVNGTLSCFCDDQYQSSGLLSTMYGEYGGKQICFNYVLYQKLDSYYYIIVSVFIIVYNYLLAIITKPILKQVGFHLRTHEEKLISVVIFVCMCIDTIVLPIMIGANFVEYRDRDFLNKFFTGDNTDFGFSWYQEIGTEYVVTLLTIGLSPALDFLLEYLELSVHRWWARKTIKERNGEDYL